PTKSSKPAPARFPRNCAVDDILVDFRSGAIRDDEALPLAGAPQLRLNRQYDRFKIGVALHSRLQCRGDLRPAQADIDPIGTYDHLVDDIPDEASHLAWGRGEPAQCKRACIAQSRIEGMGIKIEGCEGIPNIGP